MLSWTWEKGSSGTGMCWMGVRWWRGTLLSWQGRHSHVHMAVLSHAIPHETLSYQVL